MMSSATPPCTIRTLSRTTPATHGFKPRPKAQIQFIPAKSSAATSTSTTHSVLEAKTVRHHVDLCLSFLSELRPPEEEEEEASSGVVSRVKGIHGQVVKLGMVLDSVVGNRLGVLYLKVGLERSAVKLFDEIPKRMVPLYAALVGHYARLSRWEVVICMFISMVEDGLRPDKFLLPKILKACSQLGDLNMGGAVHGYMLKEQKSGMDVFIGNSLIDMYANCGDLESSIAVFETMPQKDVVSWTALVGAYANAGRMDDAFRLFNSMQAHGVVPDLISWNALVSGFARNGNVDMALALLEEMEHRGPRPGINSWNGVISGCVQSGWFEDALDAFLDLLINEAPNGITIASILPACSDLKALSLGKGLHAYAIKYKFVTNAYVCGSLIDMYLKCGKSEFAERVFSNLKDKTATVWNEMISVYANKDRISELPELLQLMRYDGLKPDVITYNTVLAAHARNGQKDEALKWFSEMSKMGLKPNVVSFNTLIAGFHQCDLSIEVLELFRIMQLPGEVITDELHPNSSSFPIDILNIVIHPNAVSTVNALSACTSLKLKNQGKEIHGYILRNQFESNVFVSSALVDMYAKCQDTISATKVFHGTREKNTVSWNTLMAGYNYNMKPEAALKLFTEMLNENFFPSSITIMILLSACSTTSALSLGRGLHCYIAKNIFGEFPMTLQSALINMYAKSGSVLEARSVFDSAVEKDIGLWNAMISCYSLYGMATDALCMFERMVKSGVRSDHITFTAILSVCNQQGLVEEGRKYFNSMANVYDVTPTLEHFTCMVGVLGDAGLLEEALDLIKSMTVEPDACVWATLLRSCRLLSDYEIGEMAAKKLFELEPTNTSNYITLSNIYAMAGMWDAAEDVRIALRARRLRIVKACSWVNIGNVIHVFKAGESSHPELGKILESWDKMAYKMEQAGYATKDIIFDDEEVVDPFSCFHTEKLAICFGIISMLAHTPVRVSKNVQMCIDCHTSAKFISKIDKREVFVRDGCFYHHFKDGTCSCKDKW